MNKTTDSGMMTIVLYVNDILVMSASESDIKWLIVELEHEYGEVMSELSDKFTYLGMGVNMKPNNSIELSMEKYIDSIIESLPDYKELKTSTTPANMKLFSKPTGELLKPKEKE